MRFSPIETAEYLAAHSRELKKLADEADLDVLSHILGMTHVEAHTLIIQPELVKTAA